MIEIAFPALVGPQPPILPLSVPRTGGFKAARLSPADGACGVHPYPCYHPGIDAGGVQGTVVRYPEDGTIVLVATGSAPPWEGYGPFLALVKGASGYYHLLAHLEPGSVLGGVGAQGKAGQPIAKTSSANHTHWEVRKKVTPNYSANETNLDNNIDPMQWLSMARGGATKLLIVAGGLAVAIALYLRRR
jgi:murein DD-endopeptidase MepM/ murein hydrolase activator NlpD